MFTLLLKRFHNKFYKDSLSFEDENYQVETLGVFLGINTFEINIAQYLIEQYEEHGELFVNELRGVFLVYIFDKRNNKHLVYTNHTGEKRVFYTVNDTDEVTVSNSIQEINNQSKKQNKHSQLDTEGAYQILTFNQTMKDRTIISGIKRLLPGHYIKIENERFSIVRYYKTNNTNTVNLSKNELIDKLDSLFKNAVNLEFQKDKEYGFTHLAALSGGLDCRMTTFVAHEMGYKNITNYTFSQTNFSDMTLPMQMSSDLNNRWIFYALDHAKMMYSLDELVSNNEAGTNVIGQMHGSEIYKNINTEAFGLVHSGQLGDVVVGAAFMQKTTHHAPCYRDEESQILRSKVSTEFYKDYDNQEDFLINNRAFNGLLTGNMPIQHFSEVTSPFMNVDFINFCLSIPLKEKVFNKLYKKWIISKHPLAAKYEWASQKTKITTPTIRIIGRDIPIPQVPKFFIRGVIKKMGLVKDDFATRNHMNPFEFWYQENDDIQSYYQKYFDNHIDKITDQALKEDCRLVYRKGNIIEKVSVLTVLSANRQFCS